ncbi:CoA-transferase [Sulfolobales archaeon HS-7]|nr:CoA-transferase [Sulfolobales archaeon HS-7]
MRSKAMSVNDALSILNSGDEITISGISIHRNPISFLRYLTSSGIRGLSFVDREPGLGLELLLRSEIVKRIRVAMSTLEWFESIPPYFRRKVEAGEVEILEDTCGAFMAGIRAGAFGIPFVPVRGVLGSDLVEIHEKKGTWKVIEDPFSGEKILAVRAINPDVAIIHVHKADEYGNAEILGPLYEDEFKAKAAKKVIITTEEIVDREYFKGRRPNITTLHVSAVVEMNRGAEPTSMFGLYDADYDAIMKFLEGVS